MQKIKILYILPKTQRGGAETQLLYLLKGINKDLFEVYLGTLYSSKEMEKEFSEIKKIKIINFKKRNGADITIFFKIARFLRENKIDIIHSFMGNHHSYLSALLAGNTVAIGGIMGTHDKDLSLVDRILEFRLSRILAKFNKLILVSCSQSGMILYAKKHFPPKTVYCIPNGIDYNSYSNRDSTNITKEFQLKNKLVLGTVGRLVESKNHIELIKMFKGISAEYSNVILMIVGDGPLYTNLKKQSEDLGLRDKIIFTGHRSDTRNLLSAMDIFLFSSLTEGWPNVLGEAMSASLPVVSFDVGDVKYIVKNGINGYIVGHDINAMKKRTIYLIKNAKIRKILGLKAADTIRQKFSINNMVLSYEKLYVSAIDTNVRGETL